ncbi:MULTISPECIES: winged-helix domain-containing protein [Sporosarcina]|uniref:Ribosomal protein S19E (S16A) n=1 Tax=Sporosarcina psychrophila TaxID=1476 RepID=A0ABV2K6H5_SPOPS
MRKLHVISIQKAYLDIVVNQLVEIFGDEIELSAITLQELTMDVIAEQDIVILSKEILKGITRPFIPESCPIIIAKREVNIAATKDLYKLLNGQQILVINDTMEHAVETARSLKSIYFEHDYIAYDPMNLMPSNINWIVTPGEKELVPREFENVIDIAPRTLDFKTVLETAKFVKSEMGQISLMNRFYKSQLALAEKWNDENELQYKKVLVQQADKRSKVEDRKEKYNSLAVETMRSIIDKIEEHGFLEESLAILAVYKEAKGNFESFGRAKVKLKLRDAGITFSDQQLRLRLEILQEIGLVNARQGRGGTKLSDKGETFLKQHNEVASNEF